MGLLDSVFGGGDKKVKSESSIVLPDYAQTAQEDFFNNNFIPALNWFSKPRNTTYNGPLVAGPNDWLQQAWAGINSAPNLMSASTPILLNKLGEDYLSGKFLDPSQNKTLQGAINASFSPLDYNFKNITLPQLQSSAVSGGAWGSNRGDISQAIAANDLTRTKADISSKLAYDEANRQRELQLQAPNIIQQAIQLKSLPAQALLQTGQMKQAFDQQAVDAQRQQWQDVINGMLMRFMPFMQMFGQIPTVSGTEGSTTQQGQGWLGSLLGHAASAALPFLGSQVGSLFGGSSPGFGFGAPGMSYGGGSAPAINPVSFFG